MRSDYEGDRYFQRKSAPPPVEFADFWPSPTRGDGKVVDNNARTGGRQGKSNLIRKAHCRQCGFPTDLSKNDSSGGSLDGNGACYVKSTGTTAATLPNGTQVSIAWADPGIRQGAGCPLCGSKNASRDRSVTVAADIFNTPRAIGF